MTPSLDGLQIHNVELALHQLDGDRDLLGELLDLFLVSSRKLVTQLTAALAAGDTAQAARLAHSLKGASANVAAERLRALAQAFEQTAKLGGTTDQLRHSLDLIECEVRAFSDRITSPNAS